jgi:hypothetical protein
MEDNKVKIGYGELGFTGLKFSEDKSQYSWETKSEYDELCNSLVEDGSELSKIRYQNILNLQYKEEIHVKLSFSFLLKFVSYFLMGVCFMAIFAQASIFAMTILGMSSISYLLHKYFLTKTRESYMGYKMAPEMLKLLFA